MGNLAATANSVVPAFNTMKLRIKAPDGERVVTLPLDGSALIAGRGQQATLHLPDPDRALSREHASLRLSGATVEVEVVSRSLGVATSRGALAPGERSHLAPGDSVTMGAYTLVVEATDTSAPAPWAAAAAPAAQPLYRVAPPAGVSRPMGFSEGGALGVQGAGPAAPIMPPGPMSEPEGDGLQTIQQFLQPTQAEPLQGRKPLPPVVVTPTPIADVSTPPRQTLLAPAPADTPPSVRQPVGQAEAAPTVPSWQQKKVALGSMGQPTDSTGPNWLAQRPVEAPTAGAPHTAGLPVPGHAPAGPALRKEPGVPPWAGAEQGAPFPAGARHDGHDALDRRPAETMQDRPAAAPAPDASTVALPSPSPEGVTPELLAFSEGLGLPLPKPLTAADWHRVGGTLRQLVDALNQLMQDRAALKSELRMNRTERYLSENNPYKADIAVDDLLRHLICGEGTGSAFMPADSAVREAADDLRAHNLAIIAASRASVEGTLREFSPDQLRKHLSVTRAAKVVALMEHGQLWRSYMAYYEQKSTHMGDWLDAMFEKHFVDTYTQEALRLSQQHISLP